MGLTLGVGRLAAVQEERDLEEVEDFAEPYRLLNEVLSEAGQSPHIEPTDLPWEAQFESQMWGYSGLHTIRRLAAHIAVNDRLPPTGSDPTEAAHDEILRLFCGQHDVYLAKGPSPRMARLFGIARPKPRFQRLICHSDCEGFYIPQDFSDVIIDTALPQRTGLGGMIGLSRRLLAECQELAALINLPAMDEEADELIEAAESPAQHGELWQMYGVEAFGLVRLIAGCETSMTHGSALVFM